MTHDEFLSLRPGDVVLSYTDYGVVQSIIDWKNRSVNNAIWCKWYKDEELTKPLHEGAVLYEPYVNCEIYKKSEREILSDPEYDDLFI